MYLFISILGLRIVLPVLLVACVLSRCAIVSIPYLLLIFYAPFVPLPTTTKFTCRTKTFHVLVALTAAIVVCAQLLYKIVLRLHRSPAESGISAIAAFIGLEKLHVDSFSWSNCCLLLDAVLCLVALCCFLSSKNSVDQRTVFQISTFIVDGDDGRHLLKSPRLLQGIAIFSILSTLLLCATLQPSIPSLIYFTAFLSSICAWSTRRKFQTAFIRGCHVIQVIVLLHTLAIFLYHMNPIQFHVNDDSAVFRLLGLKTLVKPTNKSSRAGFVTIHLNESAGIDALLNPFALLLCFYSLAICTKFVNGKRNEETSETNAIPLQIASSARVAGNVPFAKDVADFIRAHSNIVSNLMMMIWSIMFHSWSSFVFLLMANALWILPVQSTRSRRLNYFAIIYASLLQLIQFYFCLDLKASEFVFSKANDYALNQIGFVRYATLPCIPLLLKTSFMLTFCFTLRQQSARNTPANRWKSAGMSVSAHDCRPDDTQPASATILRKCIDLAMAIIVRLWVWIILLIIFVYAVYGSQVTVFRTVYMALFLVFVNLFQLSMKLWRKMLYMFWIAVIVNSMLTLILIYTYQFEGFDAIWNRYAGFNQQIQQAIGLHRYKTRKLLFELCYFTFLVVMTAIQLLIFHERYVKQFVWVVPEKSTESDDSSVRFTMASDSSPGSEQPVKPESLLADLWRYVQKYKKYVDFCCLFVELHYFKVILALGFFVSLTKITATHFVVNLLCVVGCMVRRKKQRAYSSLISLIISVIILVQMIASIIFIPIVFFNEHFTDIDQSDPSTNTADTDSSASKWLGIAKLNGENSIFLTFIAHLMYVGLLSIINAILHYQQRKRFLKDQRTERPKVMFPRVCREDADKNLNALVKYLFNYVFYKFGVEVTFLSMLLLVVVRADLVAAAYAAWLAVLAMVPRKSKRCVWVFFQAFIVIGTAIQYIIVLRLPPSLDAEYPEISRQYRYMNDLLALRNSAAKLMLDFFVLLCVSYQSNVFNTESKPHKTEYPGGQNNCVVHKFELICSGQMPHRTHDFVHPRNWLDILKCAIYFGFFWTTLAILLLTGTYTVNVFSLGYLMAAFGFCYVGGNFYMKPIRSILGWWKLLMAFNVTVILVKSIARLQINFTENNPWLTSIRAMHHDISPAEHIYSGLVYDCICFGFLLFQDRIFRSYDFCHVINESKAAFLLDSKGSKLIADRMRQLKSIHDEMEKATVAKIKQKVDRIKCNQRQMERGNRAYSNGNRYNGRQLMESFVDRFDGNFVRRTSTMIDTESVFVKANNQTYNVTYGLDDDNSIFELPELHTIKQPAASCHSFSTIHQNHGKTPIAAAFIQIITSITLCLYKTSRNYRHVHKILAKEKDLLKPKYVSDRNTPSPSIFSNKHHSLLTEFVQAVWFALIANTETMCYLIVFGNAVGSLNENLLFVPLLVLVWATLSIPRPSKFCWITLIVISKIGVSVQILYHLWPQSSILSALQSNTIGYLVLLYAVLFHRSILKYMALWTFDKRNKEIVIHAWNFLKINSSTSRNAKVRHKADFQITADVYTPMFLCDLFNFFVLMFGFSSFSTSPENKDIRVYLNEDQIPFCFLATLLVQFVSMILDRALYLRRSIRRKLAFHLVSILVIHIWFCNYLRVFGQAYQWPPLLFYFIKCVYFILSAYQIRCGYPSNVSGNVCTAGFTKMHRFTFELFHFVPFLVESRTLLDWICTKTALSLSEWFKMEDIYKEIFLLKCERANEEVAPRLCDSNRGSITDYLKAFGSLIAMAVLIWAPWALFTFDHTVAHSNIPYEFKATLDIGPYGPMYTINAHMEQIHQFTKTDLDHLKSAYGGNDAVQTFLSDYDYGDIAAVEFDANSTSLWGISPPSRQRLIEKLRGNGTLPFRLKYTFTRISHEQDGGTTEFIQTVDLINEAAIRLKLLDMLGSVNASRELELMSLLPKFLKVTNARGARLISIFMRDAHDQLCRDGTLRMHSHEPHSIWWELSEKRDDDFARLTLAKLPYANQTDKNIFYVFSDKLYPSSLSPYIGGGIIGLYSTYILLTSKFFRQFYTGKISSIWRQELPYVDRVLRLCLDIYLVREQGDFKLEAELYGKLIFLYRSPESMIRWTRMPTHTARLDNISDIDETEVERDFRKHPNR